MYLGALYHSERLSIKKNIFFYVQLDSLKRSFYFLDRSVRNLS